MGPGLVPGAPVNKVSTEERGGRVIVGRRGTDEALDEDDPSI